MPMWDGSPHHRAALPPQASLRLGGKTPSAHHIAPKRVWIRKLNLDLDRRGREIDDLALEHGTERSLARCVESEDYSHFLVTQPLVRTEKALHIMLLCSF
jgi:hypothetical protein